MKRNPLKRRTPLRRRSERRVREDREYEALRRYLLERRYGTCAAEGFHGWHCAGRPIVHHVLRRSQGGTNHPANLLVVCEIHHRLIHSNPREAVDAGLLRYRHPATGRLR